MSKDMLSVEQSAELIRRGVRPDAASMIRIDFGDSYAYVCGEQAQTVMDCVKGKYLIAEDRVFTTLDILHILPRKVKNYWGDWCELLGINMTNLSGWCVSYGSTWCEDCGPLKDLLYEALIWCLDNNQVSCQWLNE